jgi:hypothetical protein
MKLLSWFVNKVYLCGHLPHSYNDILLIVIIIMNKIDLLAGKRCRVDVIGGGVVQETTMHVLDQVANSTGIDMLWCPLCCNR